MQRRGWDLSPRALAGPVVASAGAGTLFLPWLKTGSTKRSALHVVSALRGAGLLTHAPAKAFFAAIALLPGLAGASWLLALTGYRRAAGVAAAAAGVLLCACALVERHVAHHRATGDVSVAAAVGAASVIIGMATILGG